MSECPSRPRAVFVLQRVLPVHQRLPHGRRSCYDVLHLREDLVVQEGSILPGGPGLTHKVDGLRRRFCLVEGGEKPVEGRTRIRAPLTSHFCSSSAGLGFHGPSRGTRGSDRHPRHRLLAAEAPPTQNGLRRRWPRGGPETEIHLFPPRRWPTDLSDTATQPIVEPDRGGGTGTRAVVLRRSGFSLIDDDFRAREIP